MDAQRTLYREDHELFRTAVRRFVQRDYLPRQGNGAPDRPLWLKAGHQGLLCVTLPAQYGGGGDFGHAAIIREEFARAGLHDQALSLHSDIVAPCIARLATDEQRQRWLPGICSGELVLALAWADPDSADGEVRTRAHHEHDHYRIRGSACAVGNGDDFDLLLLACQIDGEGGDAGLSLIVVERDRPGLDAGGTAIGLADVRVPRANLLGQAGRGQACLDLALQQQHLLSVIFAASQLEQRLEPVLGQAQQRWDPHDARAALAAIKTRALSLGHELGS